MKRIGSSINPSEAASAMIFNKFVKATMLLIAATCVLVIAAPATRAADAPAPKKELRPITFRLHWFPGGEHSYLYYGAQSGVFERAGFKINIVGGRGSSLAVKLIGSGSEDAGLVSADYVLLGLAQGLETRSI